MWTLASDDISWLAFLAVIGLWIFAAYAAKIARTFARERTRREIAAYIAEGSLTPEQGERLMKAGERPGDA